MGKNLLLIPRQDRKNYSEVSTPGSFKEKERFKAFFHKR